MYFDIDYQSNCFLHQHGISIIFVSKQAGLTDVNENKGIWCNYGNVFIIDNIVVGKIDIETETRQRVREWETTRHLACRQRNTEKREK